MVKKYLYENNFREFTGKIVNLESMVFGSLNVFFEHVIMVDVFLPH